MSTIDVVIEQALRAAIRAPSVHNTQPWVLEFHDTHVSLYERLDRALPRHDPLGRDRLISCGAALEHVVSAMRILGWAPEIELRHDRVHPGEIAWITAAGRAEPSDLDRRRQRAISARHSHREPFAAWPVEDRLRRDLLCANTVDGVGLRAVTDPAEIAALARLLNHSAFVLRADRAYQRELTAWTAPVPQPLPGAGVSSATRRMTGGTTTSAPAWPPSWSGSPRWPPAWPARCSPNRSNCVKSVPDSWKTWP